MKIEEHCLKKKHLIMERNTCVGPNAFLASTESSEIFGGFGDNIIIQFHNNSAFQLAADRDIQKAPHSPHF